MTVTRYKRQAPTADSISEAVLGVVRHKRAVPAAKPAPAKTAKPAKPAPPAAAVPSRTAPELVAHHDEAVKAPKERMRINPAVLARAKRKSRGAGREERETVLHDPFQSYAPPPGVLPEGAEPKMALDSGIQQWAQTSFTNAWNFSNPMGEAFAEGIGFLGYAYLSQLTQRAEFRRISERIATEMTRKWIRLTVTGEADPDSDEDDENELGQDKAPTTAPDAPLDEEEEDDADGAAAGGAVADADQEDEDDEPTPEEKAQRKRNAALQAKIKKIDAHMKRFDVRGKFKTTAEYDGWMGRSHLYIDTGAGDDPDELKSDLGNGNDQLSKEKFEKGSLRGIKHVEPIWCYPVNYNANNPLADDWYNPQVWFAMQKQVHVSRLLTFVGRPVPDILKPSYAFGGLSMSQMAKPYVDNWLRTRQAVIALIESFSVSGVYTNAQSLLQGGGEEVLDRIDLFNSARSNAGAMVLDKETEEFFNISTPLGTLDHLQAQSQEQMSSVSGIPLIVLLGITPSGLNASSEGELRVFYDMIHAMQESLFREKLHRVICFLQLDLFGEVDPAIGFEFEPLWSLDEKGEAEVRKIKAETHQIYVDMGVIGQEEVRSIEIEDDDSPYNGLDPDDMPDPPADDGMVTGKQPGGGGGESEGGDGGAMEGAADRAITEVAEDVFAFDDGQFDESKVKRDQGGKFSTTGAGGAGESKGAIASLEKAFKTKKEHIAHLLTNGTTPKDLMQAMGWPSVSMPAQAKSLGMKLEKKDGKYFGTPMTDAEKAELKAEIKGKETDKAAQQILKNAGIAQVGASVAKLNEKASSAKGYDKPPQNYGEFLEHMGTYAKNGDNESAANLMKYNPAWAEMFAEKLSSPAKEGLAALAGKTAPKLETPKNWKEHLAEEPVAAKKKAPQATAAELKKASKTTTLPINTSNVEGVQLIKDFNAKYAQKEVTGEALNQKVQDYKDLQAGLQVAEAKNQKEQAEAAKKLQEKAEKAAAEKKAKEKAELDAKFKDDPELKTHYEAMEALFGGEHASAQFVTQAKNKVNKAGLSKVIRAEEAVPIIAYSGSHYGPVNAQLRSGKMNAAQYKFMKSLNAGLDKLPAHDGITYRKVPSSAVDLSYYEPGHFVEERGFTSTSKNQDTWHGDVQFIVHGKSGRDISKLSSHPSEAEVLFKSGTRFMVETKNGSTITLKEL